MGNLASRHPLQQALLRAEGRVGRTLIEGRYHCAPRRLSDDYAISGKTLGEGFSGPVVSARNRRTAEEVAVKTFLLRGIGADRLADLASEVEIFLSLDHPHIARLIEVYESEDAVSLVMERMDGGELFDRWAAVDKFSEAQAAEATGQMLAAVHYLHREGVAHRDLKLENWLYDQEGSDSLLKLIDFGFSQYFLRGVPMRDRLGTAEYMAPEVSAGCYAFGSCDMWSLGVIVFALLAGYMPFGSQSECPADAIIKASSAGVYAMLEEDWKSVSQEGIDFVRRLLIVEPSNRLTSAQALAHPWIVNGGRRQQGFQKELDCCIAGAFLALSKASQLQRACLQLMAWSLTLNESRNLRDVFIEFDRSKAGVLKVDDLKAVLVKDMMGGSGPDEISDALRALVEMDVDQDGELHYSDFLAAMLWLRHDAHGSALAEAFRRFDVEGRGYITPESMHQVLGEFAAQNFWEVDTAEEGRIFPNEFAAYLQRPVKPNRAKMVNAAATHRRQSSWRGLGQALGRVALCVCWPAAAAGARGSAA